MGGNTDILIGVALGSGSIIGLSYVVSQICARLLAEHRPKLSSEAEIYGEVSWLPQELRRGQQMLAGGGQRNADPFATNNDIARHRERI